MKRKERKTTPYLTAFKNQVAQHQIKRGPIVLYVKNGKIS